MKSQDRFAFQSTLDRMTHQTKSVRCAVKLLLALGLCGCSFTDDDTQPQTVFAARAFDHVLPLQEVCDRIPDNASTSDSTLMAQRYVDQWIREQVLVQQAETHLPLDLQTFEREIRAYRNALLLHHYKERYVQQRLEQEVPDEDALAYYQAHKDLFVLTDYAVRATFVHVPLDAKQDIPFIETALMDDDSLTSFPLQQWCVEHGAVHSLNPEAWWYLEDLVQEVPIALYRTENQLASRKLIQFEDDERIYFLRFHEHALIDGVAPFEVVQDRVEELILHGKKQELLLQLEEELLIQAWQQGSVEKLLVDSTR